MPRNNKSPNPQNVTKKQPKLEGKTRPHGPRRIKKVERIVAKDDKLLTKSQADSSVFNDKTGYSPEGAVPLSNSAISVEVPVLEVAIQSLAYSPVSIALARGWGETVDEEYPAQAYRYLLLLIAQAINNTLPQQATGPKWLALLLQAMVQKTIPSRGGAIAYKFTFDIPSGYPSAVSITQPIGPTVYGRQINFGKISAAPSINGGFPVIDTAIPWNVDDAFLAFTSLYSYLANAFGNNGLHRKVSLSAPNEMTNDPSMFASPIIKFGSSTASTGGFFGIAINEIPIKSPIFSAIVSSLSTASNSLRGSPSCHSRSGDGTFLTGALVNNIVTESQLHFKTAPRFKAVDFNRFLETLYLWVSQIQSLAAQDTTSTLNPADLVCPLTLQEVAFLLRNEMMKAYAGTQPLVQGLFPRTPTGSGDNEFVAFVSGFGTSPYGATAPLIPHLLKENIQACRAWVNCSSRGGKSSPVFYIPVLGAYIQDSFEYKDYTYTNGEAEATVYLSFTDPGVRQVKKGGKKEEAVSLEIPISIIDGNSSAGYIAINSPEALGPLVELWNTWIKKVSSFSQMLSSVTNDGGINVLRSIGMTDHWYLNEKKDPALVSDDFYSQRLVRNKVMATTNSPYKDRVLEVVTSQTKFMSGLWNGMQSLFIRPVNLILPSITPGQNSSFAAVATSQGETNQIISGQATTKGYSLAEAHKVLAMAMVKNKYSPPSSLEAQVNALEAKGQGGLLGTIATAFFPGAGAILSTLGL